MQALAQSYVKTANCWQLMLSEFLSQPSELFFLGHCETSVDFSLKPFQQ